MARQDTAMIAVLKSISLDRWAQIAVALILASLSIYFYERRYAFIHDPLGAALLWDSRVYMVGGIDMAHGQNPYPGFVWRDPFSLPYISPPFFTNILGVIGAVIGEGIYPLFCLMHVASIVLAPLLLSRMFLGKTWTDAALGYAVFLCGFGGWGVTTVLAGNFGSTLYVLIFAAMAYALKTNKWLWFHVAVACACQIKMPYALLWAVPVMAKGWDWKLLRDSAIAGAAAALPYVISYVADPAFFNEWLAGLSRQVTVSADVGFSAYGALYIRLPAGSSLPLIGHALIALALFWFLLLDRTRGMRRVAALIVLAIVASPRMKEYDMAFAAIPAAALYLSVLAPAGAAALRRAVGFGAFLLLMALIVKLYSTPVVGVFVFLVAFIGAILMLAIKQPARGEELQPA